MEIMLNRIYENEYNQTILMILKIANDCENKSLIYSVEKFISKEEINLNSGWRKVGIKELTNADIKHFMEMFEQSKQYPLQEFGF